MIVESICDPAYIVVAVHHSKMHEIAVDSMVPVRIRRGAGKGKTILVPCVEPRASRPVPGKAYHLGPQEENVLTCDRLFGPMTTLT